MPKFLPAASPDIAVLRVALLEIRCELGHRQWPHRRTTLEARLDEATDATDP
jgi:hypothetical protein